MSSVIRDVVVKIRLEQVQARLMVPDSRAFQDGIRQAERGASESMRRVSESSAKTGGSFKEAGAGAIQMARGIAFLTAANEDDLRVSMKRIAAMQGVYDVYRGGVAILQTVTSTNMLLAGSNTLVATSSSAAAAGMTALNIASGPVGIAAIAIGGALAIIATGFRSTADEAEESGKRIKGVAEDLSQFPRLTGQFIETSPTNRVRFGEASADLQNQVSEFEASFARRARERSAAQGDADVRLQFSPLDDQIAEHKRRQAEFQRENALMMTAQRLGRTMVHTAGGQTESELDEGHLRQMLDIRGEEIDRTKELIQLQREKHDAIRGELETQKRILQTFRDQTAAEQGKVDSAEERIGRMSGREFGETKRLLEEFKGGGEMNPRKLMRLEQLLGSDIRTATGKRFEAKGEERDAAGLLGGVMGSSVNTAMMRQTEIARQREAVESTISATLATINDRMAVLKLEQAAKHHEEVELLNGLIEDNRKTREAIGKINNGLQKAKSL